MSKFNSTSAGTKTENLAGGEAYSQTPELELISILFTSFLNDTFYRSSAETMERLKQVISDCDKLFVAKASVYARTVLGMRSVTHFVASELAKYIGGEKWSKNYYEKIIYRPDDMTEILSCYFSENKKLSNAIKGGFRKAFGKFNAYSLAKYKSATKKIKLIDVVNLVHPKPFNGNEQPLKELVKGELKSFDTWEVELSKIGADKNKVWKDLLSEKKLGYFALLRNLRNILQQSPDSIPMAIETLLNESLIKNSLVLPFRFQTAYLEIKKLEPVKYLKEIMIAISKAVDISLDNVVKFDGETLVVLDVSGSMDGRPAEIGSLFSSVLVKANNADFMVFSDNAEYKNINPLDSTLTIAESLKFSMGGTDFHSIFQTCNKKYDRVIILSDMQGWIGYETPVESFIEYKNKFNADPFIYSFDLAGYGTLQFPESKVFCLAGFSEKIMDFMKYIESDKNIMLNEINKIEL